MPRVTVIKTNFTAGEISPRLLSRVDIARYQNGARTLYNTYPLVHGGARRRAGLRYTAAAKNATKRARLVPFVFNREQAFMLEFGEQYVRFYTPSGQIESSPGTPYEVAAPWDDTELSDLRYVQGADTLFLAHASYPMRKLVRYANTNWKLSVVEFEVPPSDEIGDRPATALTLGAVSGSGVTATTAAAAYQDADVGRYIESGAGRAQIVGFTSTTQVTVDIIDAFAAVGIASGAWTITESPKTGCTPSASGPIGAACTLTLAANGWKNTAQVSHLGKYVEINGGLVEITGVTSALIVDGIIRSALSGTAAAPSEGWALRETVWNAVDGYPRAVTLFEQRLIAGGSTKYPYAVWGSKTGEYFNFADGTEDSDGFFFNLASDQVNLIEHLASTRVLLPLTFGGEFSVTGGVEKPITPTNAQARLQTAYGCSTARPARVANEIIYVQRGGRKIRALGYRVETDAFNAPDISVLSEHITGEGILELAFQQEPDQVVWMVRADGFLVSMSIDRDQDAIGFGRHETDGLFESVATIPNADDGTDQLWAVVVRTINGVEKRYVERFEEGLQTDSTISGAVSESAIVSASWAAGVVTVTQTAHGYATDDTIRLSDFTPSEYNGEHEITVTGANTYTFPLADDPGATSVVGTAAKATVSWSGLDHLEAKTVDVIADGYVAPQKTVTAGAVTLNKAAYAIEVGLHYKSQIVTLPPELGTGQGSAQGNAMSIHEIIVRFYKSKGGTVNGRPILTRKFGTGAILDQPVPEFTGDKPVENLGWGRAGSGDSDGSVTIEQDQPLPMQVLGVITRLTVNDG
jgi:hypothetical protein